MSRIQSFHVNAEENPLPRIREAIEHDIVSGRLIPGMKLDEEALAARYGASRTPVREAFQQLASQGHIELRPHMGAFVAKLNITELVEMFETMAFLEAACAGLASRRHTNEDRKQLAAAHEGCLKAAKRKDPDAFYAANARFHECIYAASHNDFLAAQTLRLRNRLEAYRRESTFHAGLMALTIGEHERFCRRSSPWTRLRGKPMRATRYPARRRRVDGQGADARERRESA